MHVRGATVGVAIGFGLALNGPGPIERSAELPEEPVQLHSAAGWGVPAVDASAVYFLTRDHKLVSVDQGSGRVRWVGRLGAGGETTAGSVVRLGEFVVVAGDFDLYAFDRITGVRRWKFSPAVGYGVGIYMGAIADGVVLTGSPSGRVYAIDAIDGRLRWNTSALGERVTVFAPEAGAGGVAAGYTDFGAAAHAGGVAFFDKVRGRLKWQTSFPSSGQSVRFGGGPIAVDDLVVAASSEGTVYAFEQSSGRVRWTVPSGIDIADDYRPMTLSGRTLVVGSLSGWVTAIDIDSQRERWRRAIVDEGSVAFRIHSDRRSVYVPYVSGKVVAVDIAAGYELWRAGSLAIKFEWPPALGDDRIFLTAEGGLYVLRKSMR